MKKQNTRREFIKRGAQIAGAGLLTTGLLGCNALLDETDGGGLSLRIGHTTLYWTNSSSLTVNKSSINGAGSQTVLNRLAAGVTTVNGIAVCPSIGKIYWTEREASGAASLKRSNIDGSGVENLYTSGGTSDFFSGVAVDVPGGKVYWGESAGLAVGLHRADLDGSNPSFQITVIENVNGVALDTKAGKIYYAKSNSPFQIRQANLDGSGVITLYTVTSPVGIALDVDAGKVYWTESFSTQNIRRANSDGSSGVPETVVTQGTPSIRGITLDVRNRKMYWADSNGINRANIDVSGISGIEAIITGGTGFSRLDLG